METSLLIKSKSMYYFIYKTTSKKSKREINVGSTLIAALEGNSVTDEDDEVDQNEVELILLPIILVEYDSVKGSAKLLDRMKVWPKFPLVKALEFIDASYLERFAKLVPTL